MNRESARRRLFEWGGLTTLVLGASLFGTAILTAGPSGASGPTGETGCARPICSIVVSPDSGLAFGSAVEVTGAHFAGGAHGGLMECNLAPGEPTINFPNTKSPQLKNFGSLPVGCSSPAQWTVRVKKNGTFFSGFIASTSREAYTVGPPATGTDSAGGSAAADAADYPCPPTQAQVTDGVSCAIVFHDAKGRPKKETNENAFEDIGFTAPFSTTTMTTTTTTGPCEAEPATASAVNRQTGATATLTVDPGTCLANGTIVTVTASGLAPSTSASLVECNTAMPQPTVPYMGSTLPVSCSKPVEFTTASDGSIPPSGRNLAVVKGTVGPPEDATDSSGNPSTTDAAGYPCPPTPAQAAAGVLCVIAVGDTGGDGVVVPISFNPDVAA